MKRTFFASLVLSLVSVSAIAAPAAPPAPDHVQLAPGDLKWMPAPSAIPPGVQLAVLRGDPFAEGIFTVRLRIPANYTFAPHWHPTAESFTVLKGRFFLGMGDTLDKSKATALPAMGYASLPAMHHHYAYTEDEGTVIDLTAYGPFQIYYVHAADDPLKSAAMKH